MTSLLGRLRQTAWLIASSFRAIDDTRAAEYLSPAEYALYLSMPRASRQHHQRVMDALLREGHNHPALMKAALLHDVGKMRYPFSFFDKSVVVLAKIFVRERFARWGAAEPSGWRRRFVISAQHPAWSAEMAAAVGMEALALELIERHQTPLAAEPQTDVERLLVLLQAADDQS